MNFARDVVDRAPGERIALVALAADGSRRRLTFAEMSDSAGRLAGALASRGVERGDVVMTLVGNRPEWVLAMVACFRLGAVVLPCAEMLRSADLRVRMDAVEPRAVIADERNLDVVAEAGFSGTLIAVPDERLLASPPAPAVELDPEEPALIVFTSGTAGEPKPIRHAQRYLPGQRVQAESWLGAREGDLCWCTAASGWSKSARNAFVAPWLRGATALIEDARFDPAARLETIEREGVNVLCMAPTEYRTIAKSTPLRRLPSLRHAVAAGEPLNPEIIERFSEEAGLAIHDGYGQTETGALTGMPLGEPVRPGSMGRPLPGFGVWIDAGELVVDPSTVPTFFLDPRGKGAGWERSCGEGSGGEGSGGEDPRGEGSGGGPREPWRTGDRVRQDEDGYLWFEGRTDDVIISSGYRIGPFEVESALVSHPAVAEAAAVAAPDEQRGAVVRAIVVLSTGREPGDELARELQEHVKRLTAPYKYPRLVEFVERLPKTASGKIKRAELRGDLPTQ